MAETTTTAVPEARSGISPGHKIAQDWVKNLGSHWTETPETAPAPPAVAPAPAPVPAPVTAAEPAPVTLAPTTTVVPAPAVAPAKPAETEEPMPRDAKGWKAYKQAAADRLKVATEENTGLKRQIEDFKKSAPAIKFEEDPRYKSIDEENKKLSEQLRIVAIERHPRFQQFYDNKVNAQIDLAKRVVGAEHADRIATLLKMPDNEYRAEQIDELTNSLSPTQQARIGSVLNSLESIQFDRQSEIERAKSNAESLQNEAKTNAEKQQAQQRTQQETMFGNVVQSLSDPASKEALPVYQRQEGNEEWNKGVDARINWAKSILFNNQTPEVLMKTALQAAALPALVKSHIDALEKIKTLEAQVKGLSGAQPTLEKQEKPEGGSTDRPFSVDPKRTHRGSKQMAAAWVQDINREEE